MIEHYRRRPFVQETMRWDGTPDSAAAIKAWVGVAPDETSAAFLTADEAPTASDEDAHAHALLYVAHNRSWVPLPVGYRVVKELDSSGFYPLSPSGLRAGFEDFPVVCTCGRLSGLHPQLGKVRQGNCPVHDAPKPPRAS